MEELKELLEAARRQIEFLSTMSDSQNKRDGMFCAAVAGKLAESMIHKCGELELIAHANSQS